MNITKEVSKLENSALKLTVTIKKEDVESEYKKNINKYAKDIQIPGFRKGHVPVSVLEQKFGSELKKEAMANLTDEALNQIFAEEESKDIRPLQYSEINLEGGKVPELSFDKDVTFSVIYDVFPTVEIQDISKSKIEIKEPQVTIGDEELNEELKAIQERNASVIDKKDGEPLEKDNIVTIDYKELDDAGSTVPGSEREDFIFTVGTGENIYKIDDEILGMKKDETKEITKTYSKDDKNSDLAGKTKKISVKVKAIKVRNLPALDDELAQDVSEKYKTLEDLKNDITKRLNAAKDRKIEEIKEQSLLEQLVEKNPIALPSSMVRVEKDRRWRMMAQQFQTTPEQLEKLISSSGQSKEKLLDEWTGDTEKLLKSRLIVETLMEDRHLRASSEELDSEIAKIAEETDTPLDDVKERYSENQAKEYLIDQIKERKLFSELFNEVKVLKGEKMSFSDLFKNER